MTGRGAWAVVLAVLVALGGCAGPRAAAPAGHSKAPSSATARAPQAAPARTGDALTLHLSPTSGPPGTVVAITGRVPALSRPVQATTHTTACWASCSTGLTEHALRVHWSHRHPGTFTLHLRVPVTPWVTPTGVHPLTAGRYRIGVQCLLPKGCVLGLTERSAPFRLTGPTPTACLPGRPCGRLVVSPASGPPGTTIQVSGWAPLSTVIGHPFGPYLGLSEAGRAAQGLGVGQLHQSFNGDLFGTLTLPPAVPGVGGLRPGMAHLSAFYFFSASRAHAVLAQATFRVTAAPTWASLGRLQPMLIQPAMAGRTTRDPTHLSLLARCPRAGGVALSADGGRTWSVLPTSAVTVALRGSPYTLDSKGGSPRCATVAPAPGGVVFAAFPGAAHGGPPPAYWLPLVTRNAGRSWQLLPAPSGNRPGDFSRFQYKGGAVQALFWTSRQGSTPAFSLEQTTDGCRHWTPGRLACPPAGPCVTWGPAPVWTWPGICNAQAILWSRNAGRSWARPVGDTHVCYTGTGPQGPYACSEAPPFPCASPPTEAALGRPWPFRACRGWGRRRGTPRYNWWPVARWRPPGRGYGGPCPPALRLGAAPRPPATPPHREARAP